MSHEQDQKAANKKREEERAAVAAAAEEYTRTTVRQAAFRSESDPLAGVFIIPAEAYVSSDNRYAAPLTRTAPPTPTTPESSSTSSTAPASYALLSSTDTNISKIYSAQASVALFAPPKKIVEQEQQEERMLRYLVAGTILTSIGGALILAGCFTLSCPPLAASLIAVGVVLKAIGLFCYGMAAAISVSNEKPKKNGYELQGAFDQTNGTQAERSRHDAWAFL